MAGTEHIERRRIEAAMIGRIYREMCAAMEPRAALEILTRTVERAAYEEGRAFAARADGGASLSHFKTVLAEWEDALHIEVREDDSDVLRFDVTSCDYIRSYEGLGLSQDLVALLSCSRDAPFARGYSSRLEFSRCATLAEGHDGCDFCYRWR
ncbi:MAG: L-2-amino-thiazoline-4-carboxylic acid hydrolase [bacterium]|nr:L-2-amino-thiazoline-4-carboxylic acid hydrolase [bacterium]